MTRMIPLRELELSRENARRQETAPEAHEELMASIDAHGVLNNLLVRALKREKKSGAKYAVIAGGRRFRALKGLEKAKKIGADHPVPCAVAAEGNATELSLHENVVRMPMHIVDEYDAYQRMVTKGVAPPDIAARMGVPVMQVNRALRLAGIHEEILEAARRDEVPEETLRAFAATADKERQLQVWTEMRRQHAAAEMPPAWIRREVLAKHVAANHPRVRFVGLEAYKSAGGELERDLFTPEDEAYVTDVKLLDELARDRLKAEERKVAAEGWGWTDIGLDVDELGLRQYGRIEGRMGPLTADEAAADRALTEEIERAEARIEELEQRNGSEETDEEEDAAELELNQQWATVRRLQNRQAARVRRAREQRAVYDPGQMGHAGVILTIDSEGELFQHKGLVRAEDSAAMPPAAPRESDPAGGAELDGGPTPLGQAMTPGYQPTAPERSPNPEQDARAAAGLTTALAEQLETIRTNLVKATLAGSFETAFDLLTFQLARRLLTHMSCGEEALHINSATTATHTIGANTGTGGPSVFAESEKALEEDAKELPLEWRDLDDRLAQFEAFSKLPTESKQALFAAAVARTLERQLAFDPRAAERPEVEAAIARLEVPLAAGYRPDAAHFWERVKKADALAAARAVLGPEWAAAHAKSRRAELAAALEKVFTAKTKPVDLSDAQWTAVRNWTPPGFRAFDRQGLDPERPATDQGAAAPPEEHDDDNGVDESGETGTEATEAAEPGVPGFDATPATEAPAFLQE